jgi:hypothetical protein
VKAFHDGFLAAAIFGLIAFVASFLIHDEDAAASMAPRDPNAAPVTAH